MTRVIRCLVYTQYYFLNDHCTFTRIDTSIFWGNVLSACKDITQVVGGGGKCVHRNPSAQSSDHSTVEFLGTDLDGLDGLCDALLPWRQLTALIFLM